MSNLLNLNVSQLSNNFLMCVKDVYFSDLSFFFSDVLSCFAKENYTVIIINFSQSYSHYTYLLSKSGVPVKSLRDKGKIIFLDAMASASTVCDSDVAEKDNLTKCFQSEFEQNITKVLFQQLKKTLNEVITSMPGGFLLFIDEVTALLNLGVPLQSIQPFVMSSLSLCTQNGGTLCVGGVVDENDTENKKLINYLNILAGVIVNVESLQTGCSKDTHGKVQIELRNKAACSSACNKYFFKVGDKGAELLTLGV